MSGGYLEDASQEATAVVDLDCPLTQWTCPNIKIKQYKLAQRAYNALRALRFAVNCYQERTAALREQSARVRPQARRGAVAGLAREQLEQLNFTDILICRRRHGFRMEPHCQGRRVERLPAAVMPEPCCVRRPCGRHEGSGALPPTIIRIFVSGR